MTLQWELQTGSVANWRKNTSLYFDLEHLVKLWVEELMLHGSSCTVNKPLIVAGFGTGSSSGFALGLALRGKRFPPVL